MIGPESACREEDVVTAAAVRVDVQPDFEASGDFRDDAVGKL